MNGGGHKELASELVCWIWGLSLDATDWRTVGRFPWVPIVTSVVNDTDTSAFEIGKKSHRRQKNKKVALLVIIRKKVKKNNKI